MLLMRDQKVFGIPDKLFEHRFVHEQIYSLETIDCKIFR